MTDRESFEHVKQWMLEIERYAGSNVSTLLVGNKRDLVEKRAVSFEEAEELAATFGVRFVETSAKDSTNVEQAFALMASEIKGKVQVQMSATKNAVAHVDLSAAKPLKDSTCCGLF